MTNILFRAYALSPLALKVDSWSEKIFRRTVWLIDLLESAFVFHTRRFLLTFRRTKKTISETERQSLDDTLLNLRTVTYSFFTLKLDRRKVAGTLMKT